jgi:hypothetical protein
MKMTASEKIARAFEIVGYLWLAPSIISLIYPFLLSIGLILSGSPAGIGLLLIPLVIFGFGVFLLMQYYRHSRGLLGEDMIIPLWAGTLVFNLLLFAPVAYGFFKLPKTPRHSSGEHNLFNFGWGLLAVWLAAAILMSLTALISRFRNQKYR